MKQLFFSGSTENNFALVNFSEVVCLHILATVCLPHKQHIPVDSVSASQSACTSNWLLVSVSICLFACMSVWIRWTLAV